MTTTPPRVLVLGGTGFVGRSFCERWVTHAGGAAHVVVPSRHPARAKVLQTLPGVNVVGADVHDETQLTRLVFNCDVVVNLVAILHGSPAAFARTHAALPRTLAGICTATGVRRVVHVSALGVGPDAPSHYLRSKTEGEAVLREAGLDLTVLRPSVIFGAEDRFLNLFAALQAFFPLMPLAGARAQFQPVWVGDVAQALVHAIDRPDTIGQTYECAGPQVYTLGELVQLAGRWSGHARPVLALPSALGALQAALLELMPGEPLMSRDNLHSMRVPNVATGTLPGLGALGITPTALEAVMPQVLGGSGSAARLNGWRQVARHE